MNSRFIDKEKTVPIQPSGTIYNSKYKSVSPTPNHEVSFNWLNTDFPYWHNHDHWEIYVVTFGSFNHAINNEEYAMHQGSACIIRPNDVHKLSYPLGENKGHHIAFMFTDEYAKKLFSQFGEGSLNMILNDTKPLCFTSKNFPISQIIDNTLYVSSTGISIDEKTFKTKVIINALFSDFISQYFIKTSSFPKWLSDFLIILNNPKLKESAVDLAKYTPYSYSRLSRIFKQYMETTIVDYIKSVKYKHACNLLAYTDLTVLEISNELYYDSISYFNKLFKSFSNLTPTEYRNQAKKLQKK